MDFEKYKTTFREKASSVGRSKEFIDSCLRYADNLNKNGLPIIYDVDHLCSLLDVDKSYVLAATNSSKHFYRRFSIPKSNGRCRTISEPLPTLKEIQRWILKNILYTQKPSKFSKAYRPKTSIIDNAKFHLNKHILLKMDISSYYDSITDYMVYDYFLSIGYNKAVSMLLTRLCTNRHCLPQGAPTSSFLSNLITKDIDEYINQICLRNPKTRLMYTRYADDISISGDFNPSLVIREVTRVVRERGLAVNREKTKVISSSKCQEVTGIVVNQKLQKTREYRRRIRLEVYYIKKNGIERQYEYVLRRYTYYSVLSYAQSVLGRINHCLFINPSDQEMKEYRQYMIDTIKEMSLH